MKIYSTSDTDIMCISALVYGQSKVGKTRLISTCESPFVLNVENSLVALRGHDIPVINIKSVKEFAEAMGYLTRSPEAQQYKTICLDSVSELAELILSEEKARTKDPRQAYGIMQDEIFKIVRALTALPFDCYVIAKAEKGIGNSGENVYSPFIPSSKGAMRLPYLFDETFALRNIRLEGERENKVWLQCYSDAQWEAGDKSGALSAWEEPNLKNIFDKIRGRSIDEVRTQLETRADCHAAKTKAAAADTPAQAKLRQTAKGLFAKAKKIKDSGRSDEAMLHLIRLDWYALCEEHMRADDKFIVPSDVAQLMHDILDLEPPVSITQGHIDYGGGKYIFVADLLAQKDKKTDTETTASIQSTTDKEATQC